MGLEWELGGFPVLRVPPMEGNQLPSQRWVAGKLRCVHRDSGCRQTVRALENPAAFTPEGLTVSVTQDRKIGKGIGTQEYTRGFLSSWEPNPLTISVYREGCQPKSSFKERRFQVRSR